MELYAHTPNRDGHWHCWRDHTSQVSSMAAEFARAFEAADLARCLGSLHDVGKLADGFQRYLHGCWRAEMEGRRAPISSVDHKAAGAIRALSLGPAGELLALAVLGHHGGLPAPSDARSQLCDPLVSERAREALDRYSQVAVDVMSPGPPPGRTSDAASCEMLLRMLFSCLVDADYLDTESHFEPDRASVRAPGEEMSNLWVRFANDQASIIRSSPDTRVNRLRRAIYEECVATADTSQGAFRLTIPTGGGKTRAGMAFALKHAVRHSLRRVVVAMPYTSIIDQNVREYRKILWSGSVIEHSSTAYAPDGEGCSEHDLRMQLATENWDSPIVVTTTVQLFESLFANKPSRCRKLHNLANSVIVLDEVQALPVELVQPILDVLRELVANYGVTLVLSTATQPAFNVNSPYLTGFSSCREIVPEPERYFEALQRVDYRVVHEPWAWERVADEMRSRQQAMCVLNSRKDALHLFRLLDDPDALHLSTLMCPAHRREVLAEIRRRLREGLPCRVVSTQVVEAGVDLDFPCVMRALGPLDRIVQAAGRCNREGLLERGEVIVFTPADGRAPQGNYRTEMDDARIILSEPNCDLNDPHVFERYFQMVWQDCPTDARGIRELRSTLNYPKVASRFRMIRDDTVPVVIYYGDPGPAAVIEEIERKGFASRDDWRALATHTTSVYPNDLRRYLQRGDVRQILDGLYVWIGHYDRRFGLSEELPDPADLMV